MAYVPDFEHDVFISYRQVDNKFGWVNRLEQTIRLLFHRRAEPGCDGTAWDYSIFRDDHGIDGNESLTPAIQHAVTNSAVLVVVMSHNYASGDSKWCADERNFFLENAATAQTPRNKNRIFVVRMSDIAEPYWPTAISDQKGYRLWEQAPTTGRVIEISMDFDRTGRPAPACAQLADDIWDRLNQFFPQHNKWKRAVGGCFEKVSETHWREMPVKEGDLIHHVEERATFRGVVDLYDATRRFGFRLYGDHLDFRNGDGYFTKYYDGTWEDA